jgi:hypothetical protein
MKCYYSCKGKIYKTYPPNELCSSTHHFCYYHYQVLLASTKEEIRQIYIKNCTMVVNTKSSKEEEST